MMMMTWEDPVEEIYMPPRLSEYRVGAAIFFLRVYPDVCNVLLVCVRWTGEFEPHHSMIIHHSLLVVRGYWDIGALICSLAEVVVVFAVCTEHAEVRYGNFQFDQ